MTEIKTFIQKSHIGLIAFFGIKLYVLYQIANGSRSTFTSLVVLYLISVLISISPFGELLVCLFARAVHAPRIDMQEKMDYLLDDILSDVKVKTPDFSEKISLKLIYMDEPYVCALGRRTIAFSPSFLELPEDEQRGLLAGEVAHLVLRHNVLMMLAGCANPLFFFMWLMLQVFKWLFTIVGVFYCIFTGTRISRLSAVLTMLVTHFAVKLWTAICMLFIYFENRQNTFVADRYAADIGYGFELARAIDDLKHLHIHTGMLGALFQSKPHPDARINSLIEYGVPYRGY